MRRSGGFTQELRVLDALEPRAARPQVIVITAHGSIEAAVQAVKIGRERLHLQAVRAGAPAAPGSQDTRGARPRASRAAARDRGVGASQSELFGHERGAFTGAVKSKLGRLEQANGGTLFLDEIGELEPEIQAKLLRVLQEREFERLGGTRTLTTDARIVCATRSILRRVLE